MIYKKIRQKRKTISLPVSFILFLLASSLFASRPYQPKVADPILEPWRWRSYPELDGLGVQCLMEAMDGSIWFGLQKGAIHYDGLCWTLYDDQNGLTNDVIYTIVQAKDSSIYFGTQSSGIIRFRNGELKTIWTPAYDNDLDERIMCITETPDQRIWACIWETGILSIQNDQLTLLTTRQIREEIEDRCPEVTFVEIPDKIIDPVINGLDYFELYWIHEIGQGDMLIAINDRLLSYHLNQSLLDSQGECVDVTPDIYKKSHYMVEMYASQNGMIWIYDMVETSELFRYDPQQDQWKLFDLEPYGGSNRIMSIQETDDGILWIGDFGRFFKYQNGQWRLYQSPELDLPTIDIHFLTSSEGNLWIAGERSEVYRVDYGEGHWMTYQDLVYQCEIGPVEWFISIDGAVVSHEKETDVWTAYDTRDGLIDEPVALLPTRDGKLWAAGSHQWMTAAAVFQDGKWMKTIHPGLGYNFEYRSVCELKDGTLLFGVKDRDFKSQTGGIAQYDPFSNKWSYIRFLTRLKNVFCGLRQTHDGTVWYGGVALYRIDGETSYIAEDHEDFGNAWFDHVEVAPDGTLWTIKGGVGVYRYDIEQQIVTKYTTEDGLAGTLGSSILCLNDNSVLVATDKGISRFDGYSWTKYVLPEILKISRESGDMRQSEDGKIWLNMASRSWYQRATASQHFTEDMLSEFRTIRFRPDRLPPDTQVDVADDRIPYHGNVYAEWIGSDAWNQSLPEHLEYSYRLNGGEWSYFSDEMDHLFLGLESGNYTLEVRSRDGGFNIDPTPALVQFTVLPPVWRQPWFVGMVSLFVAAIGFLEWRIIKRDKRLRVTNTFLEERTEQLQASNTELEVMNKQLYNANKKIRRTSKALKQSNEELNHSQKALKRSNRELEQFAYMASHDLQEPLRMVSSYVSLLARRYKDKLDATAEEFIGFAVDGAHRMQQLINDLLFYSRVTTRGKPLVPTDCEEVFKRAEMNLKIAIEENQGSVKHDPLPTVNADTVQLERLFQNLISNALKYHGEKHPKVHISAEKNGKAWTFSIKDNGIGIGPDDRERVFGIFQRLHTRDEYEGTGIGLAVCKKIVERHGGEIWVESEIGKGSVFKFTMPMIQNA